MAIADLRREYSLAGLRRNDLAADPIVQFRNWFEQATGAKMSGRVRAFLIRLYKRLLMITGAEPLDVNAMTLATVDKDGRPSARIVLLKGVDDRGFVFFTNYDSRKGQELAGNPNAALVFYWGEQERQVCIAGQVSRLRVRGIGGLFSVPPTREPDWSLGIKPEPPGGRPGCLGSRVGRNPRRGFMTRRYLCRLTGVVTSSSRSGLSFGRAAPIGMHDRFCYTKTPNGWIIDRLSINHKACAHLMQSSEVGAIDPSFLKKLHLLSPPQV